MSVSAASVGILLVGSDAAAMGNAKLPGIAAQDIGRSAYAVLQRGPSMIGKSVGIAGEHLSGSEMAAALSGALGGSR